MKPYIALLTLFLCVQLQAGTSGKTPPAMKGLTAQDQSNAAWSTNITRKIRADIVNDKSLSTNAKNIKIIVLNNQVLLKGPVENHTEVDKILKAAAEIAPTHSIYNELVVTN
jgi:osmotically-inducible protein OsmY